MDHAMRCICRLIALGGHAIVASFLFSVVFFDAQAEESPAQTFQDALRLALVKDPRIAASIAAAEAEEARVTQARTAGRLQVTSTLDVQAQGQDTQTANLELSQDIYSFGRIDSSIEAALARATLAWIEVARTGQDVFGDVALSYADVLQADALVALQRSFRDEIANRQEAVEGRLEAGLASITEVQALGRLIAEAEVAVLSAEQEAISARLQLERYTGIYVGRVRNQELLAYLRFLPSNLEEARFFAEENAPESRVSEQEFRIAEADIEVAQRANTPSLQAYGSYDYGRRNGTDLNQGQAGVRLSLPIYQGGCAARLLKRALKPFNRP